MQTRVLGIMLVIIGILMMAYTGFTFITTKSVIDLGSIQVNRDQNHFVHWSPIVGALLFVGGIAAIMVGKKSRA